MIKPFTHQKIVVFGLIVSSVLMAGLASPTVAFAETVQTSDQNAASLDRANSVISKIAPGVLDDLSRSSSMAVISEIGSSEPVVTIPPVSDASRGLSVTIDYAEGEAFSSGGLTVLHTSDDHVRSYVEPTEDGVRMLTALGGNDAPTSYSYTFDVPEGAQLMPSGNGFRLSPPNGISYGTIGAAWAIDSAGRHVPTHYEWNDRTLTQFVDLDSTETAFPVLLDPSWGYSVEWSIGSVSPSRAWSKLHTCFNCFFPVSGAPNTFPSYRQDLPLVVAFGPISGDFHCTMDEVWSFGPNDFGFQFLSAPGHVDGLGSNIAFEMYRNAGGENYLSVGAHVVTDFGPLKSAYLAGAAIAWKAFADNLKTIVVTA